MRGFNIGSGQRRFDTKKGWINVDKIYWRGTIRVGEADVASLPDVACDGGSLCFPDQCADIVVLHHCYEHFHLGDADGVIREAHRVLKRRGSLLVFCPDLKKLAVRWLMGKIDDYTFCVNTYGAWMGEAGDDHHWGFSQDSLDKSIANIVQWGDVKPFDWRLVEGASLARDWWICATEAVK